MPSYSIRLNKLLSERGIASRRTADQWISQGRIQINGKKVYELGVQVDPVKDQIVVDGRPIKPPDEKLYLILHKPRGVVTTLSDPEGRPTIRDLIPKLKTRVYPVGRLDWDTEGLLLLTNDGEYANKIMNPKFGVTKTYYVKIQGDLTATEKMKLLRGVSIIGGKVKALQLAKVKVEGAKTSKTNSWWKIIIAEGKNRQIRLMFSKLGHDVLKLRRVSIGGLRLGKLPRGEFRFLSAGACDLVFKQDL